MITWSQLIHPHSHKNRSYAPDETVTTHLSFTKSIVVKIGVVLCQAWSEKSTDSIGGVYYYLSKY